MPRFEIDVVPETVDSPEAYDEGTIPSNIYEYFEAIENGQFPFFNNTSAHISTMRNGNGETLLIAASRCGHAHIVERLVNDIDIEESDNDGWNALLNAAWTGNAPIVKILLDAGASIEQSDLMGWTPMLWACYKNRLDVVELLIERGAHINVVGEEDGLTPLLISSGRGYTEIVQRLLSAGSQVNARDKFGNTALIWASRKGYEEIIYQLLNAGVEIDAVGMQSSTALMLATRGNYTKVVEVLLSYQPNVNLVDNNGLSALGISAREGYAEITSSLIQSGAFVNTIDRFGNPILASAVRSGNVHIIRLLLEKHADINAKDSEGRTPLHIAIDRKYTLSKYKAQEEGNGQMEKHYMDIIVALLEKRPNLEIKNKDGDTSLIRAVKYRDIGVVQLLVNMGAKISATDDHGDNSLHIALRAKSRRLAQILLVNPGDSKLLYRPNKLGETPYSIDQETSPPVLPSIFGPGSVGADTERTFVGYDIYSDVLADIVCEPTLSLPLIIGLYAKWGSGKSFLLPKIRDSMKAFSRTWLEGIELYWSWTVIFVLFAIGIFIALFTSAIFMLATSSPHLILSFIIGAVICASLTSLYGFIYYGSEVRLWNSSIVTARHIARWLARFKIVVSVLTLNAPIRKSKELIASPVSFLFADDHRLSFIGGEQALVKIIESLFQTAEEHYGILPVRLFFALRVQTSDRNSRLQTLCGIPTVLYILVMLVSIIASLLLFIGSDYTKTGEPGDLVAAIVFMAIFVCCVTSLFYILGIKLLINSPRRRLHRISHKLHSMQFERMIEKLQREVDLLVTLVNNLDAFTNSQTRFVVMIDGLDSCEQNKMMHLLDAISILFCSRQDVPFIVVLAIDPNVVISSIQQNLRVLSVSPVEITGSDYINNIVTMPFFLDQASLRRTPKGRNRSQYMQLPSSSTTNLFRDRRRSETFKESRLSLRDQCSQKDLNVPFAGTNGFGSILPSYDHLNNVNPRTMRRIINSMALTGRLLRIFDIQFSWIFLFSWISLIEQWPLRMSWLIDVACGHQDDSLSLAELYAQIKHKIVVKESLVTFDRNHQEFEKVLRKACAAKEHLTVGHAKTFFICTSNLDPSLRRIVREQRGAITDVPESEVGDIDQSAILKEIVGDAEFLFDDLNIWNSITKQLQRLTIDDLLSLIRRLAISQDRLQNIVQKFIKHNLTGLVLYSCELQELKNVLDLPLGDWTLLQVLIETLRRWKPAHCTNLPCGASAEQQSPNQNVNSSTNQQRENLQSIREEEQNGPACQTQPQIQLTIETVNGAGTGLDDQYEDCDEGASDGSNAGSEQGLLYQKK